MKSTICSLLFLSQQALSSGGAWTYDHMAEWETEVNTMCGAQDESPIDILTSDVVYDEDVCTAPFEWNVDFTKQTFQVKNNGHSIALTPAEETTTKTDSTFTVDNTTYKLLSSADDSIASFVNYFQPLGSDHNKFCLAGLHFHWGLNDYMGSEHLVDGYQYPLELHFVHYSCHHPDIGEVLGQFPTAESVKEAAKEEYNDVHQLAVIGVFFEVSEEDNPAFDTFLSEDILNKVKQPDHAPVVAHHMSIGDLIPYQALETKGYYAYEGSLTTPPCTDIVRWHVMNARGSISRSQLVALRTLMTADEHVIANNFREVQDNVNTVYACMERGGASADALATEKAVVWTVAVFAMLTPIIMGIVCIWQSKREKVLVKTALINHGGKQKKHDNHGGH
jgi:carbonic anhydrase